jgi:hypothetical protein
MPETEFATVARHLEETTAKLKSAQDPQVRQKLLAWMRLMLAEADRLLAEEESSTAA